MNLQNFKGLWSTIPTRYIYYKYTYILKNKSVMYPQVQLDGSVRSSGVGSPNWQSLVQDLPPLDSLRTRITDGLRQ